MFACAGIATAPSVGLASACASATAAFAKALTAVVVGLSLPLAAQTTAPAPSAPAAPIVAPLAGAPKFQLPLTPEEAAAHAQRHREADSAKIRLHRLNHLEARLHTDPEVLHATCRYESEIGTAPPPRHIALTFDDGPEPGQTEHILEVLRRHQIGATFFLIGDLSRRHPELVQKIVSEGRHRIGNHSWDHPNFHDIGTVAQAQEVSETDQLLGSTMATKYFRYPYGNSSCETNTLLHDQGYRIVGWHIDSCDWAFDKTGSVDAKEAAICGVLPQYRSDFTGHVLSSLRAHGGGIVLMHEIHPNTLKKLDEIVRTALEEGYVFDTLDNPLFESAMR